MIIKGMRLCDKAKVADLFHGYNKVIDYGCGNNKVDKRFVGVDQKDKKSMENWDKLKTNSVDAVISYSVIEHMTPKEVYEWLKKCHDILVPNGLLGIHSTVVPWFWDCMSHKKPYPPNALLNFFNQKGIDDYPFINFSPLILFYECKGFKGRSLIEDLSNDLAVYFPRLRADYLLLLSCIK